MNIMHLNSEILFAQLKECLKIKLFFKKRQLNLYRPVDDKYKCLFIHIPKTAGISISKALFGTIVGHRQAWLLASADKKKFNEYFKFAFVRNPYERIFSAFLFLKQSGRNQIDKQWSEKFISRYSTFSEFILSLKNDKGQISNILQWQHFTPQIYYVCDWRNRILVDYLGHFDTIENDFKYIKKRLGIDCELGYENKSDRENFQAYYTKESKRIVKQIYKKDFELIDSIRN
jgi:hypothetical protein